MSDKKTLPPITERVKTVEDALAIAGTSIDQLVRPEDTPDESAYKVIKTVIRVLNEDWQADFTDSSQYKYVPYFRNRSGSGLSFSDFDDWFSDTGVGSRLCYRSYDIMLHGVKILESYYNQFLN